jgi:CRISPR system Cascade subunit CasE
VSDQTLFMVQAQFDRLRLLHFGRSQNLDLEVVDDGYLVHAALVALFGDAAPKPFVIRAVGSDRVLTTLGYCSCDADQLRETARLKADPVVYNACDIEALATKALPAAWASGALFGFETLVCPTVRLSGRSDGRGPREVDVFLQSCWRAGPSTPVDRGAVYGRWLAGELGRGGAAWLRRADLVRFQRQRLARRDRGRPGVHFVRCERPAALFTGTLEIADSEGFAVLLHRGLGRHRAFGFGMPLLRPLRGESDAQRQTGT